jgi:hypothetical protein
VVGVRNLANPYRYFRANAIEKAEAILTNRGARRTVLNLVACQRRDGASSRHALGGRAPHIGVDLKPVPHANERNKVDACSP